MNLNYLPPISTLLLVVVVVVGLVTLPFLMATPKTGATKLWSSAQRNNHKSPPNPFAWRGPRPEAKREILTTPLFAEDRKLPLPFDVSSLEPENLIKSEVQSEEDSTGMNPPEEPAPPYEEPSQSEVSEEPEPVDTKTPLNLPKLRLVGTFIIENKGVARALLVETKQNAEEFWVDEGSNYEDWVLAIVSPSAARLESSSKSLVLELWVEGDKEDEKE